MTGVSQLVLIATNAANSAWSVDECAKREGSLHTMVGVHPYKAISSPLDDISKLKQLAASKYCVAIGTVRRHPAYCCSLISLRHPGECGFDLPKAEKIVAESKERVEKEESAESPSPAAPSTSSSSSTPPSNPTVNIFDVEEVMRIQEQWLDAQIQLALELNKPLFFHERGAVLSVNAKER